MSTESVKYELSLRDLMSKGLTDINRKMDVMENKLGNVQRTANTAGKTLGSTFSMLGTGAAVAGLLAIGKGIFDITAKAEMTQTSFAVLLGSQSKATKLIGEIRKYAAETPFETGDLEAASNTLLGFGIKGEKVMGTLKMLGDVSMGNADKFQRLSLAFAQTHAAGKLMGQDLLQYINAGFNPLKIISEQTGKSIGYLREKMSKGLISADMVARAFEITTSKGGAYFEMLEKQSQTLSGKFSTLVDNIKMTGLAIGESNIGGLHTMLDLAAQSLNSLEPMKDLFSQMFAPFSYAADLFKGMNGDNGPLFFFKSLATVLQTAMIPAQVLTTQLFFIADIIKALFGDADLMNAFENYGNRITKPFSTLGDIWTDSKEDKKETPSLFKNNKTATPEMLNSLLGGPKTMNQLMDESMMGDGEEGKAKKAKLAKQVSDVSGGAPKVVNITIEALIKDVKNYFSSSQNAMAESKDFLDQLQDALGNLIADTSILQGNAK